MAPGLKLPRELLFDVVDLFVRNRRWARCRVNKAFDDYLLNRMGPWLLIVQQLAINNVESIQNICGKIRSICGKIKSDSRTDAFTIWVLSFKMRIFIRLVCPHHIADRMLKEARINNDLEFLLNSATNVVKKYCQINTATAEHILLSIAEKLSLLDYRIDDSIRSAEATKFSKIG